jgi:hypothetical protein
MSRLRSANDISPTRTLLTVHWLSVDSEHLKKYYHWKQYRYIPFDYNSTVHVDYCARYGNCQ